MRLKWFVAAAAFTLLVPRKAHATGILVGADGAALPQPFARVIVVHGERAAHVLEQPWPARAGVRPRVYVAPMAAAITKVEIVPSAHDPIEGSGLFLAQENGAVIGVGRERDPCERDVDTRIGIETSDASTRSCVTGRRERLALPFPEWKSKPATPTLPAGLTLDAATRAVVAGWLQQGSRVIVVPLDEGDGPPAIRWTAAGIGPRGAVAVPSTPEAKGGPREVVVDVYAEQNLPFAVDGLKATRIDTLTLADDGSPLDRAFRAAVDGFFANAPDGVLLESAASSVQMATPEIFAPVARMPSTWNVDVEGKSSEHATSTTVECPSVVARLLPTKVVLELDRDKNGRVPEGTPRALRDCLASTLASRRFPVSGNRYTLELSAAANQEPAEPPLMTVSRLRVRPSGATLRIVAEPGTTETFVGRVLRKQPWTGPIACAAPVRGRFQATNLPGAPVFAALVDTGTAPPPPVVAPSAAPPVPAAPPPPPPSAEPAAAPARRASSCASSGVGWILAVLAVTRRRRSARTG